MRTAPASSRIFFYLLLLCLLSQCVLATKQKHSFSVGDKVPLMVNIVGPYNNPTETYGYYEKLPLCRPPDFKPQVETLGEVLEGNRLNPSVYEINFREEVRDKKICSAELTKENMVALLDAVKNEYYFQLFLDDLPLINFIGTYNKKEVEPSYFIYTHLEFAIEHNGNNIVRANMSVVETLDTMVDISSGEPQKIDFTYSVTWAVNDLLKFESRMQNFADVKFTTKELEIHWFSIINSVALVVILTGFLFAILVRMLRADYAKYSSEVGEAEMDEFGWKLIQGDVFRFPKNRLLLSSIVGVGIQFLLICFGILILGGIGLYYPYNRGSLKTSLIVLYCFTCVVAGYTSANFYKQLNGESWVWNILLTASIFVAPLFGVWSVLNTIAWIHRSSQALPLGTILAIFLIWSLIALPLTVIGGIIGKNRATELEVPCRTRNIPRPIPPCPWYHSHLCHLLLGGFLPFSAISIELYYIFGTIWGYQLYNIYGILMIVFFILLLVTSFVSIALLYFQLCCEDHEWWWRSVFNGGSTGLFILLYAVFYMSGTSMSGVLQLSFFFGYMFLICYSAFLMLGTAGFLSSFYFIKYIFRNFRVD